MSITDTAPATPEVTTHHHQFDVVIVGAGGAGMRAAIAEGRFAAFAADFRRDYFAGR